MNTEKIARGWALIAEGAMELSLAYESLDSPVARAGVADTAGAQAASPPSPAVSVPSFDELPPEGFTDAPAVVPVARSLQEQHVEAVLSQCPDHQRAWKVVPAGVSKRTGNEYSAFYSCPDRDCKKKPVKAFTDKHPIPEGAAA